MQIYKDNIRKIIYRFEYDYKVGDKVMLTYHTAYKYETLYTGPFVITQFFTTGTKKRLCDETQITYNISRINPYKYDTKIDGSSSKNMSDDVNI